MLPLNTERMTKAFKEKMDALRREQSQAVAAVIKKLEQRKLVEIRRQIQSGKQ